MNSRQPPTSTPTRCARSTAQERDKRLRADGNEQYVEVAGEFAHYVEDPYVEPASTREPLFDEVEVVDHRRRLRRPARRRPPARGRASSDIRIIEKGGDFGGTWYWNRYPGAMCDVESYIYLPLLEELGYVPKEKYSHAPEILEHSQAIGRALRPLRRRAASRPRSPSCAGTTTTRAGSSRPTAATRMRARFVVHGQRPAAPAEAAGHPRHRRRSRATRSTPAAGTTTTPAATPTGTSPASPDKRVGIIGTGATAVQCVPHLGEAAEQLYVFQRTPSSIDVRDNRPTDPGVGGEPRAGLAAAADGQLQHPRVAAASRTEDLVNDGWTDIIGKLAASCRAGRAATVIAERRWRSTMELADFEKMEQIRARVDTIVNDPDDGRGAEAVLPPVLQAAVLPRRVPRHVQPAERHAGRHRRPGRRAHHRARRRRRRRSSTSSTASSSPPASRSAPTTPAAPATRSYGRDGLTLTEKWADGAATLHGLHSRGFPNCFIISLAQSGFTVNFPHMLDEQAQHIAYILATRSTTTSRAIEASRARPRTAGSTTIVEPGADQPRRSSRRARRATTTTRASPAERSVRNGSYGAGSIAFVKVLEDWRADGTLAGLDLV